MQDLCIKQIPSSKAWHVHLPSFHQTPNLLLTPYIIQEAMDKSIITGRFIGLIAVFKANKRFYGRILKDPATNDYPFPLLLQYSSNLLCFIFAYKIENVDVDFDGREVYCFKGLNYIFFCIKLADARHVEEIFARLIHFGEIRNPDGLANILLIEWPRCLAGIDGVTIPGPFHREIGAL